MAIRAPDGANKKIFLTLISMDRLCPFQGDLIYPGRIGGHEVKCCCQDSSTSSIGRLLNSGCERLRISQFHKKEKKSTENKHTVLKTVPKYTTNTMSQFPQFHKKTKKSTKNEHTVSKTVTKYTTYRYKDKI